MKTYALVGTGGRSGMYLEAIATTYRQSARLVALCDTNQTRMDYANRNLEKWGHVKVATWKAADFETMIAQHRPDIVIVTSVDRTHDRYIIRAMELGCDVITEKPMTIDEERCLAIVDAVERTGRDLRVTFNYRYAPHHSKLRELILNGTVGDVFSVHFEWLLNTQHGADYFRRWHRDKRNSGGLLVHKSTHHFDLVNFWLDSVPEFVFAQGDLRFYGKENAERRGVREFYSRCHNQPAARNDPFALHMDERAMLKELYLNAEHEDGYLRDQSVFGDGISIEDTLAVMVKYRNKTLLTYSLNAYQPWEGLNIAFNGSKGRLEMKLVENSYVNGGGERKNEGSLMDCDITWYPMFGAPERIEVAYGQGGHGGGDALILEELFGNPGPDPLKRRADSQAGAMSILTGVCGNLSMQRNQPVFINELPVGRKLLSRRNREQ